MCFYHSWLGKQSWTIFNVKRQHNQVQKMVYIYRVWNRHETRTSYLEKQHFIAHRTTKHYNREQKSICTTINLTINAISPPQYIKRQISWRITNIVYQFCEFFQAYLFCADDWRREEFLLGSGTLWRPDTSLKTTQKMYSITILMTAQIFYKTTTRELFPIALPWMITHQRWWLLVFVYKTLLFDCTFQQSHHPIIVTLNYREKNLWAVFLISM